MGMFGARRSPWCRLVAAPIALALLLGGDAGRAGADDAPSAATRRFAVATGLQSRKLYKLAAEEWRGFLDDHPQDPRAPKARLALGNCLLLNGKPDEAVEVLDKALKDQPPGELADSARLSLGMARLRRFERDRKPEEGQEAIRCFEAAAQRDPRSPPGRKAAYYRAETLYRMGRLDEAADAFTKVARSEPRDNLTAGALYAAGIARMDRSQWQAAEQAFGELIAIDPRHPLADESRLRRGDALAALKKPDEAEALYAAVAEAPGAKLADHALLRRAASKLRRRQFEESAKLYKTIVEKHPASPLLGPAALGAGQALCEAGKYAEARDVLRPWLEAKRPEQAEAARWTARCLVRENRAADALKLLDEVTAQSGDAGKTPALRLARGEVLDAIPGRGAEALDVYSDWLRRYPDDRLAPRARLGAAFAALGIGKYDVAREQASAFLKAHAGEDEMLPDALFVAGEADLRLGHPAEAEGRYRALLETFPGHARAAEARIGRALALMKLGKADDAEKSLADGLKAISEKELLAQAHDLIGRCRAARAQWEGAAASFRAALETKPDWSGGDETNLALASCEKALGKLPEAAERLKTLVAKRPPSPSAGPAEVQLGEIAAAQDRLDDALGHFREAARLGGHAAVPARTEIAAVLFRKGDAAGALKALDDIQGQAPPRARFIRTLALHRLKRYDAALEAARAFLDTKPDDDDRDDARLVAGLCESGLGRREEAVKTLRAALAESPSYRKADQAYYEMAFCLKALGREAEAAEAFERAASSRPKGTLAAESLYQVGEARFAAKTYAEAAESYRRALDAAADPILREKALHKLGWCAFRQSDWSGAVAAFDRQVAEVPSGALVGEGRLMAGESLAGKGDWAEARQRFAQVAASEARALHPSAHFRAGEAAATLKDWPAATDEFRRALALDPKLPQAAEARYGLGWALQNQEKLDEAIAAYRLVLAQTESETAARAQFMIGECLFAKKEHEQAAREFLKGAYGYPYEEWQGNCQFEAARCFEVLRRLDQARESYRTIVTKLPNHEKASAAAARLKELTK